jgi:hypothetical protein
MCLLAKELLKSKPALALVRLKLGPKLEFLRILVVELGLVTVMIGLELLAPKNAVVITTAQSDSQLNTESGYRSPLVRYTMPVAHGIPLTW